MFRRLCLVSLTLMVLGHVRDATAYGVLAHEAVVDAAWDTSIAPLLRSRFHPSREELKKARAYAYGGSLIQDLGYYPFSSRTFGDLTHYVRSGDFVDALLSDASNVDEYAFALGALAHYASDNDGHPLGVNPAVGLMYPKLLTKYGHAVTYEDNPSAHLKTEFGFDVVQIARGAYVPTRYHDFIGFEISKPVLERAFRETYGIELKDVFADFDLSIGTFRYAVTSMIPQMTKVAWQSKRAEIETLSPGITREQFQFGLSRPAYEREWGTRYDRPGIVSKVLAVVLRVVPKVGPFRSLSFKPPTPEAERLFLRSFAATVDRYRELLASLGRSRPSFSNRNFDTGRPVKAGEYRRADEAYADLLNRLGEHDFQRVSPGLRAHLLAFFAAAPRPAASRDLKRWRKLQAGLTQLKAQSAN